MNDHCEIRRQGAALVVENRNAARRNALTDDFYQGLHAGLDRAATDPSVGAVVLVGQGDFFCAGGDLNMLMTAAKMTEEQRRHRISNLQRLIAAITTCPRPVIAAVEGGAAGAGASLAFACDMIVAARGARFVAAYVNAGLVPDGGLTASLSACLPPQLVAEMCLTGQPATAERLHALGAVNRISEPGACVADAVAIADRLGQGPGVAQAAIKRLLTDWRASAFEAQLTRETDAMAAALAAPEAAEGIRAFLGKRPANFAALRQRPAVQDSAG